MTGRTLTWVTPEPVDVRAGGGGIRSTQLLRRIAPLVPVRLVAIGPALDPVVAAAVRDVVIVDPAEAFRANGPSTVVRSLAGNRLPELDSAAPFRSKVPHEWLTDPDSTAVLNHLPSFPLVPTVAGGVVVHPHNDAASHLRDEASTATGLRRLRLRRYAAVADQLQRRWLSMADLVVTVSDEDRRLLAPDGTWPVEVVPNGVDVAAYDVGPVPTALRVLLPGSLDYGPNVDAAAHFAAEVWPLVLGRLPDAVLVLAGRNPAPEVAALALLPHVEVHADVPDMADELAAARVVVVPMRYGTGTRLKALEALAARRSLVGTTVGLAGLDLDDTHARVVDDPVGLADAVVDALTHDDAERLAAGYEHARRHFDWDRLADALLGALRCHGLLDRVAR